MSSNEPSDVSTAPFVLIWSKIGRVLKFAFTIVAFAVTLTVFVLGAIPVIIYGISGFVVLAFCMAVLAGLLWGLLSMLRYLLPDFNVTFVSFFDTNRQLNDDNQTR